MIVAFLLRRLATGVLVLFGVSTITFFAIHATGDPVTTGLVQSGATLDDIARIEHQLGYDRPLLVQYGSFISNALHGRFGNSFTYGSSAGELVLQRLPYTLALAGVALLLTIIVSIPLGMLAAYRPNSTLDRLVGWFSAAGLSVPAFVIGPLLILLFAVSWRILPASGANGSNSILLPAVTLAFYPTARVTRMMRTTAIGVMRLDFIDTARSKGLSESSVVMRHVLRNALISVITLLGLELTGLIGGAVITENIFGWPGIGTLARQAFAASDFTVAQALVVVVAAIVIGANLLTDIVYSVVDPRIRVH